MQAHHGRLWVVSRAGKGATFRFTLPLASAEPHRAAQRPEESRADEAA